LTCQRCGEIQTHYSYISKGLCVPCREEINYERKRNTLINRGKNQFKRWAKEDFVILDTETTGLSDDDEIIEIAIIDRNGHVLLNTLIKPINPISEQAKEIHGISNEDVKNAPYWKEVWKHVLSIIEGKKILIYNAEFDLKMIRNSCYKNNIKIPLSY